MWPSEYMIHEHRKEMERIADQVRLARQVQAQPHPLTGWLTRMFAALRRPPQIEHPRIVQPQSATLGRVC